MLGFRGAGLQGALIRERLRAAVEEGCDLATASTLPGSVSQRNYERNGFQVAYTKAILVR
jgi:GNAT superfamily N-acetyltransferase